MLNKINQSILNKINQSIIVITLFIICSFLNYQNNAFAQEVFSQKQIKEAQILEDIYIGKNDAPVTVYEYISLTCSHCAAFHKNSFYQIKNQLVDTGKVKYVIREYPLDGIAQSYAVLARCAEKNKFFDIYDTLLRERNIWIRAEQPLKTFETYAKKFGFNQKQIDQCLNNNELLETIYENTDKAKQILNINATPTFFINGEKFEGAIPTQQFLNIVQQKLQNDK